MSTIFLGGTAGSDVLTGGDGDDFIFGNGGSDTMSGGNGNDTIYSTNLAGSGGDGAGDVMNGGPGNDIMFGSDGNDKLNGGDGNDQLSGNGGNDWLTGGAGNDFLDGGAGIDTAAYAGVRADYTVGRAAQGGMPATVVSATLGTDSLANVERLQFADIAIAYDIDGNAGQIYRLYQAVFNRVPDKPGIGYWLHMREDVGHTLLNIASGFFNSPEFKQMYASNSDQEFISKLYLNALHRPYDQGGMDYYLNALNNGVSREQILINFSESPENQAQVIGSIQSGIEFNVYGV